jgi:hypothetical protein
MTNTEPRLNGRALRYDVVGTFDTFEACSTGKSLQNNFRKDLKGGSVIARERFFDI